MISAEAQAEIDRMFAERKPEMPLEQSRRNWEADAALLVLPDGAQVSAVEAGGVASEWMEMPDVAPDRVMLFLHGGGYHAGSPRTHRRLAAELSQASATRLLLPDYRLAPEHPFPAGLEDALAAYRWLLQQGFAPGQVVLGGDSAGGGLALSLLLALKAAGGPMPAGAVLLAPWTDLSCSSPSYAALAERDPIIVPERLRRAGLEYAGSRDPREPAMSPLFAELDGLPPLLIHAGGDETMVDDSRLFAERAVAAGVSVDVTIYPGMWHVFHNASASVPEARQAIDAVGIWVKDLFRAGAAPRR